MTVTWLPGENPYTTMIGRHRLRLYDSPHAEADYPWVNFADAIGLLELPGSYQGHIVDRWRRSWPEMVHALPDSTLIVPDICVTGMFQFYALQNWAPADAVRGLYEEVVSELFARLNADRPLPEFRELCQRASLRHMPIIPGETRVN